MRRVRINKIFYFCFKDIVLCFWEKVYFGVIWWCDVFWGDNIVVCLLMLGDYLFWIFDVSRGVICIIYWGLGNV